MSRGNEDAQGSAPARSRDRAGRPILILLVVLAVAVLSVLAIQIGFLVRKDRPMARVDRDDPVPTEATREYPPSSLTAKLPGSNARVPQAAEAQPGDSMPPGPMAMRMTPEEATRSLLKKELETLERSGPAPSALTADALKTVDNLKRLPDLAGAEFSEFRCFGDGCTVTITSRSPEKVGHAIGRAPDFFSWPGSRFMSGPLTLASGQAQTVLVLHSLREQKASPSPTTR
jgi:hypothetical protein